MGLPELDAISIIEETLNSRIVTVRDRISDNPPKYEVNQKETMLARDRAEQIKEEFRSWIFREPKEGRNMWTTIMRPLIMSGYGNMMVPILLCRESIL